MRSIVLGLSLFALLGRAPDPRDRGPERLDVSGYPPKMQELYQVFEVRCSKCHSLARPINARLKPEQWHLYVKKMTRRAGSGINAENAKLIEEFLAYYSAVRDAPDAGSPAGDP